jgi:hypothetical protein
MKKLNKTLDILEPASDESLESLAKSGIIRLVDEERDHARRMVEGAITESLDSGMCPSTDIFGACPQLNTPKYCETCIKCWSDYLDKLAKEGDNKS